MEELMQLDEELFIFLNNLGTTTWDGFWLFITDKLASIPLYAVLLYLLYKSYGLKPTLVILVLVAGMITCTDQLSNFFKYGIGRLRPCHEPEVSSAMRLVKSYCGGQFGYFSAHAANSFGPAIFFTVLFKKKVKYISWFLLLWACVVAYSRIYIGVHYPLDVVTGALVGSLFGWLWAKLAIFAFQKTGV